MKSSPGGKILEHLAILLDHAHKPSKVYPTLAAGVTLPASGVAWTLGAITEVVPASTITAQFDIHDVVVEGLSANAVYEIVLYKGGSGAEVEIGRVRCVKSAAQDGALSIPFMCELQDANERISAAVADSVGTSTATISVHYHEY